MMHTSTETLMPKTTKTEEPGRRVQAAAEAAFKPVESASNGPKAALDASQADGKAAPDSTKATSGAASRKIVNALKNTLQQAADTMLGIVDQPTDAISKNAGVVREAVGQLSATTSQMSAMQDRAFKDVAGRTQENLGTMMKAGVKLADGLQSVMREWADYTRNSMQCNIDGMNSILRARSPQDLLAAQKDLLKAEVTIMLTSSVRIAEATAKVAEEASKIIGDQNEVRNR